MDGSVCRVSCDTNVMMFYYDALSLYASLSQLFMICMGYFTKKGLTIQLTLACVNTGSLVQQKDVLPLEMIPWYSESRACDLIICKSGSEIT